MPRLGPGAEGAGLHPQKRRHADAEETLREFPSCYNPLRVWLNIDTVRLKRARSREPSLCPRIKLADGVKMQSFESKTHSFIVKIWLEATAEEAGRASWRGHITHVPDGERRYVKGLNEIPAFIAPYLEEMGVRFSVRPRLREWLNRWRQLWRVRS